DLDRAQKVVDEWLDLSDDPMAFDRDGEIAFLRHDYAKAQTLFASAVDRYEGDTPETLAWMATDMLKQGVSANLAGDPVAARELLGKAYTVAQTIYADDESQTQAGLTSVYTQAELGTIALTARDYPAARTAYENALAQRHYLLDDDIASYQTFGLVKGAEE